MDGNEETVASGSGNDATVASSEPRPPGAASALPTITPSSYEMGTELARGGMGRIVRATDRRLRRPVALKELLRSSPELVARFEREALITARLQHPSIVAIYEAGAWPSGEPFYAMKLVSGRPLDQIIGETTSLAERVALLPAMLAVTEALAYAHDQGIIHRDLKPQNVLVGSFGETVVIDWGLAKDVGVADEAPATTSAPPARDPSATVDGEVMGTPAYMPPEQALGEPVDKRADVYSLGAMLYQLLAKRSPYVATSTAALLASVIAGSPTSLRSIDDTLPADLVTIVEKAMARAPADRYADAAALAADLKRYLTGQLVGVHAYSFGQLVRRWIRRHRTAVAITSIALVVLVAGLLVAVSRIRTERDEANRQRSTAERTTMTVMIEQARQAWLAGEPEQAAAWLSAASKLGPPDRAAQTLSALVGNALELHAWQVDAEGHAVLAPDRLVVQNHAATRAFDRATGRELAAPSHFLATSKDGRFALTKALALEGPTPISIPSDATGIRAVAIADDGGRVVLVRDGTLDVWTRGDAAIKHVALPAITQREPSVGVACDAHCARVAVWAREIALVSVADSVVVYQPFPDEELAITSAALAPDGTRFLAVAEVESSYFIIGGDPMTITAWDSSEKVPNVPSVIVIAPDAQSVFVQPDSGPAEVRSFRRTYLKLPPSPVLAAAFTPDGKTLVTAHEDQLLRVWRDGALAASYGGLQPHVTDLVVDGSLAVVVGNGTAHALRLDTTVVRAAPDNDGKPLPAEVPHPMIELKDGQVIVADRDRTIHFGRRIAHVVERDGLIYTFDEERVAMIWDRDRGKLLAQQPMGIDGYEHHLDVTPDGVVVVTAVHGQTTMVERWRIPTGGSLAKTSWSIDDAGHLVQRGNR